MEIYALDGLLAQNHVAVVTTFRRDGAPQQSLVTVGKWDGGLAFTTTEDRAKAKNLARDPRCALMLIRPGYRGYAVLDGRADVRDPRNTDAEALRLLLRDVYRAAAGKEHPDWDEYDRAMAEQRRRAVILRPGRLVTVGLE
ncbi:MAG: TIGR03618 family F420-dependent PPOX class oxidoreductase [SAR202 cluster bacterium]|nr:TIGR03618 family F420-dependent PPOX class oxidoreductase [SAR202 cluster bacterium]